MPARFLRLSLGLLFLFGSTASAATFNNQMVTTWAPSGCTIPISVSTFLTTNNTVYLFFKATVTTSDHLNVDWVAPNNSILSGGSWGGTSGSKCFVGASLTIINLPITELGNWRVRVWDNGT